MVRFSSFDVGLVFLTGADAERSCEIVFVDEVGAAILVVLTCRESAVDVDEAGFAIPERSLLLVVVFVDVCDWVVLGLNGAVDDVVLLTDVVDLFDSFEDNFCCCCWFVLVIGEGLVDGTSGFFVTGDDIGFGSVFIETGLVSVGFFFSSFVEDTTFVFLVDEFVVEFVDCVLDLDTGIVIVNLGGFVSLVDDEIGFVFVEIFLRSVLFVVDVVFVFVDEDDDDDNWFTFFWTVVDGVDGFLVVDVEAGVLALVLL